MGNDASLFNADRMSPHFRIARGVNPIRAWREHRSMTLEELAMTVDAPPEVILLLESASVPLVSDAQLALARALGVPKCDLSF